MTPRHFTALLLAALALSAAPLAAQEGRLPDSLTADTTAVVTIRLRDGSTLNGYVLAVTAAAITFRTLGGVQLMVRPEDVSAVERPRGTVVNQQFWPRDPSDSRLFLGPTARVPGDGHGYFGVYELFVASGGAGIGAHAMLSGGVSLFPGISLDEQVFYLAPKIQFVALPFVQLAAGAFWVRPPSGEEDGGMVFGTLTMGQETVSATSTVGFPFVSGTGFADDALIMVGLEMRGSPRVKLITENWFVPGEAGAILSGGVRVILDRATIEAAGATSTDGGFLPIVNFSLTW